MRYGRLGRTGLQVSRLALGTMNFGMLADEDDRHAVLDAAFEAGINHINTAYVYGTDQSPGRPGSSPEASCW